MLRVNVLFCMYKMGIRNIHVRTHRLHNIGFVVDPVVATDSVYIFRNVVCHFEFYHTLYFLFHSQPNRTGFEAHLNLTNALVVFRCVCVCTNTRDHRHVCFEYKTIESSFGTVRC